MDFVTLAALLAPALSTAPQDPTRPISRVPS